MSLNLKECLFLSDRKTYDNVKRIATNLCYKSDYSTCVPSAIVQIIKEFADKNDVIINILNIPLSDDQLWGFFYAIDENYFIVINSDIGLCKQNIALLHEFYHFYSAIKEDKFPFDILFDNKEQKEEDKKANAFAVNFIMPEEVLRSIFDINMDDENKIFAIRTLMEIFHVPFKTAAIRLFEVGIIDESLCNLLINKVPRKFRDDIESLIEYQEHLDKQSNFAFKDNIQKLNFLFKQSEDLQKMSSKKIAKQREIVDEILKKLVDQN